VKNHPILIKFGTLKHILNPMIVMRSKIEILKIQDGALLVITHQPIVRFQRHLCEEAERHADKDYMTKTANF